MGTEQHVEFTELLALEEELARTQQQLSSWHMAAREALLAGGTTLDPSADVALIAYGADKEKRDYVRTWYAAYDGSVQEGSLVAVMNEWDWSTHVGGFIGSRDEIRRALRISVLTGTPRWELQKGLIFPTDTYRWQVSTLAFGTSFSEQQSDIVVSPAEMAGDIDYLARHDLSRDVVNCYSSNHHGCSPGRAPEITGRRATLAVGQLAIERMLGPYALSAPSDILSSASMASSRQ